MKKITFLFILCVSLFCSQAQTVNSQCVASASVTNLYKNDADRLTLNRTYLLNTSYKDSVHLDPAMRSNYLHALLAVYNATALPARDSVVDLNIHTSPHYAMDKVTFFVHPADPWAQNLHDTIFPTGYNSLDSVMNKYHLYLFNYFSFAPSNLDDHVTLKCDSNFNALRMVKIFTLSVTQALYPGIDQGIGDNPDITDSITPNYTQLTYTYKWGDCPSGCIYRRSWRFRVDVSNCSVDYLGSYGDALPAFPSVGLKNNESEPFNLQVYPNPVKDKLHIQTDKSNYGNNELSIINSLGQQVVEAKVTGSAADMDLSYLASGLYYLKIKNALGARTLKFVKE